MASAAENPTERERFSVTGPGSRTRDHGKLTVTICLVFLLSGWLPAATAGQWESLEGIARTAEAHARAGVGGGRVETTVASLDGRLKLARCDRPIEAFTPGNGNGARQNTVVGVRCRGSRPWQVFVPVRLAIYREVLITARPLARGAVIGTADVLRAERDVATLHSAYLTDEVQLDGKVLKRSVAEGRMLTADLLNEQDIVRRGQRVTLLVTEDGFTVRMAGMALEDAAINERVRVENVSSRRPVEGIVRSPQLVEVIAY